MVLRNNLLQLQLEYTYIHNIYIYTYIWTYMNYLFTKTCHGKLSLFGSFCQPVSWITFRVFGVWMSLEIVETAFPVCTVLSESMPVGSIHQSVTSPWLWQIRIMRLEKRLATDKVHRCTYYIVSLREREGKRNLFVRRLSHVGGRPMSYLHFLNRAPGPPETSSTVHVIFCHLIDLDLNQSNNKWALIEICGWFGSSMGRSLFCQFVLTGNIDPARRRFLSSSCGQFRRKCLSG